MKQMVAPQAPVEQTVTFDELVCGFFRRALSCDGRVFYGAKRDYEGPTYWFPVLEDESISRHGCGQEVIYPNENICIIDPVNLGIKEFKWSDERPSA